MMKPITRSTRYMRAIPIGVCLTCLTFLACALLTYAGSDALPPGGASSAATPTPTPVPPPHYPPPSVTIEGNETVELGALAVFTASVSPITATIPYTYRWQATERPAAVYFPYAISNAPYYAAWDSLGPKAITVTVLNSVGSAVATRTVSVVPGPNPPVAPTSAGWVMSAFTYVVGRPNYIGVQLGPVEVTLPITYTWHVDGVEPITHARLATRSSGLYLAWDSPGVKQVTVTASNVAGTISDTMNLTVWSRTHLPVVGARE